MMKDLLFNLIGKHKYDISIYTEEIFERRCQEEIIRSDEDNSSFVYIEFDFETVRKELGSDEANDKFWEVFLASLHKSNRGSDIIGFLEMGSGLGMLLLDSKIEGWNRVRGRIEQMGSTMGFNQVNKLLNSVVKPIVYPTCIQVSGDTTTMNVVNADITG
ncbi:hypothetical protein SAMN05720766_11911 [Fibrobacter sp. UWH9]|uniref:hypothetical protein n=1 Tax=unclassified Fibrobacter TaxID=2634177 RepID=UPI00091C32C7|nr:MULTISPECIES: hypothetical protein [Fibrobacter]MCQ2100676.1 hypothetical protein [Fibrobacter sp.]MCL4102981.1 hypothetical protein [Fibrobacter succinogenes]OWV04383.1 hypothetical protein B7993_11205 [Fibrobacter sp. UWH3]OWV09939.1 hypothetical protein B7992_11560 [Fibrobacter sp. UWH1]SHH68264.1 hypothetical protein SAMN05720766_11911 [Fibrobacter sp. UWH9]